MDASTIASLLKPMNSTEIINTIGTLEQSGFNVSQIDVPSVLSQLNVTQITGLLQSNSTIVNGLLQSLKPTQLVTLLTNMQNTTSTLFEMATQSTNKTIAAQYATAAATLVRLLLIKLELVFTDSQLLGVFTALTNGAAYGTGPIKLMQIAENLILGFFGGLNMTDFNIILPTRLLELVAKYQPAIFGGYPTSVDTAPSALFMAIFFLLTLAHLGLWLKNRSLGHKFNLSLGLAFYCLIRMLGFLLRTVWSKELENLKVGLASTIFLAIPCAILPSLNLILAQRFFTWKHPIYGASKLFMASMYLIYSLVIGVIVMTIVTASVQTIYLLSSDHFNMCKKVIRAAALLICLYSLLATVLVVSSYFLPATSQDKKVLTYQPKWIKSFAWNYFAPKNAAREDATAVPEDKKHAIRIINSTTYPHESVHESEKTEKHESPASKMAHGHSIVIIAFATFCLFLADIFRCVSTFIDEYEKDASWIFKPVVMYIMFGVLETFINLAYLIGRIDLRFYKPDALKYTKAATANVAAIIKQEVDVPASITSAEDNAKTSDESSK